MENNSELGNILTQVKKTSIVINVHATGYFISERQFQALERLALIGTPEETEEDPIEALNRKLLLLEQRRRDFTLKLRFETDPRQKVLWNESGQKVDSEIAKLRRVLNGQH